MTIYQLPEESCFPDPREADPSGIIAIGGDLSPERILLAYTSGIFPWFNQGDPLLWWSPDPRFVLLPSELHISASMRKVLSQKRFSFTCDTVFEQVITECASSRISSKKKVDGTWITDEMKNAYCRLHELGFAHSMEAWQEDRLAGGLYGISLGHVFFGESMFTRVPNASKAAFITLVGKLVEKKISLIDCQVETVHLKSFGAKSVPRKDFLDKLNHALLAETLRGSWTSFFPRVSG